MAQLPPMRISVSRSRMPRPSPELLDGLAMTICKSVERFSDEIGKHGCMLKDIPTVWETAARCAYVFLATHGGATCSPIDENPR